MQDLNPSAAQSSSAPSPSPSWTETASELLAILDEASQTGGNAVWGPVGAKAFSELLRQMAHNLDVAAPAAIEAQRKISEELLDKNQRLCAIGLDAVRLLRAAETERRQLRDMIAALGGDPDEIAPAEGPPTADTEDTSAASEPGTFGG